MNSNLMNITSELPLLNKTYASTDIIGNTVGRYFDYKKETALIEHETQKVKQQAKVICRQIDAQLAEALDNNDKSFQQEMKRLDSISNSLCQDAKVQEHIMHNISKYIEMLSNPDVSDKVKDRIPDLIEVEHGRLLDNNKQSLGKIKAMSHFDSSKEID